LTVVKNKVNRPNACFTTLCQSSDFDDQSNLSPIVQRFTVYLFGRKSFIKCLAFCRVVQPLKISDERLYGNVSIYVSMATPGETQMQARYSILHTEAEVFHSCRENNSLPRGRNGTFAEVCILFYSQSII
jgi:hypothetical protein